jgi:hypothetical protein
MQKSFGTPHPAFWKLGSYLKLKSLDLATLEFNQSLEGHTVRKAKVKDINEKL